MIEVKTKGEIAEVVEKGKFPVILFCNRKECEKSFREKNRFGARVLLERASGKCVLCGNSATHKALFGRAY
jgi:hypothetical protein